MKFINKIKSGLIIGLLAFGLLLPVAAASPVSAQISEEAKSAACEGIGGATGQDCDGSAGGTVRSLMATAVNILSWIIGIVAVFMIIIGGFKFITSGGDSSGVQSARNTIIYALVGLVVAALAQVMVNFVLKETISP